MLPASDNRSGKTNLEAAALALVRTAKGGDIPAMKEMGDRIDGKVPQALIGGGEDEPAIKTVTRIEIVALTAEKARG